MKFNCPKCQQKAKSNDTHCSKCGFDFSILKLDEAEEVQPVEDAPLGSLRDIARQDVRNPFLIDPLEDTARPLDPNGTDGFGTAELIQQVPLDEADDADGVPKDVEPIGTVDFDNPNHVSHAEIGTVDFDHPNSDPNATTELDTQSNNTLESGVADTTDFDAKPTQDPNATVSDVRTVEMDSDEFASIVTLGPNGTVVDVDPNVTIENGEPDQDPNATVGDVRTVAMDTDEFESTVVIGPNGTVVDIDPNLTIVEGASDHTVELGLTVVERSKSDTVDLESGTIDFDGSSIFENSAKVAADSNDFENGSNTAAPSAGTVRDEPYGATIDVNMLGPSNRQPKGKPGSSADFSIRESTQQPQGSLAGQTGATGTTGRVHRMWHDAGVSQLNPGSTLKTSTQLASDDVFDHVQPRVLETEDIDGLVRRAAKNSRDKELIEHCLTVACPAGSGETADYQVNGFLGKGAMGVVLQARQKSIGRDVAIKMIQPPRSESAATVASTRDTHRKFLYEAQVTGKLDHPNIVPVYELGMSNGALFYSMKKISGVEWTKKLKENSQDENLDVWMKVADAMAFSHQRNIIHRDLKPDNVMLGAFGEVLVTDWGCAIDLNVQKKFSGAGSPPWMAPEMALKLHDIVGPKSDMYLLGAILYQIVVGHPPHPGKTAMEALMAAARNQIIPVDTPDPLLEIAYQAMRTDPAERYANLEEMQEAIRQYRRHSESIAICQRCESTLASAIDTNDYEKFSRSIFGFQDALVLWPENQAASRGVAQARLAYGKCALSRNDFDLCIASLDPTVPDEAEVYQQAVDQKQAVQLREKRFKTLRKSFAAAVLTGLAVSALLAVVAWMQRNDAVTQKVLAENSAKSEKVAKEEAIEAKNTAVKARDDEEVARLAAEEARKVANAARDAAIQSEKNEREARKKEEQAKREAELAAENERTAKLAAQSAEKAERVAKLDAVRRSAQVELASMRSNLALALNQVENTEMARANESLTAVVDSSSYQALTKLDQLPNMANWAWSRVKLISNRDLLQSNWGDRVTAFTFDNISNQGVMAVELDRKFWLKIFSINQGKIELVAGQQIQSPGLVTSVAILNEGKTVAFTVIPRSNPTESSHAAYHWNVSTQNIEPLPSIKNESLQQLLSTDNTSLLGGLNQGLWYWKDLQSKTAPTRIRNIQGRLKCIQAIDANQVILLAETDNQTVIHWVRLDRPDSREYMRIAPGEDGVTLRPTAVAFASGKIILGMESGQLFSFDHKPTGRGETTITQDQLNEFPASHASAIQNIEIHSDGTLLTTAIETIVRVWAISDTPAGWRSLPTLSGPTNNIRSVVFGKESHQILAVANDATTAVWDTAQQRLRQRIEYPMQSVALPGAAVKSGATSSAQLAGYDAPVISVVSSQSGTTAVSILANGRIDRWNPTTGQSLLSSSLAYVGHDPTAELVDMDVDESAGVMITSAKLPSRKPSNSPASRPSQQPAGETEIMREWEFVKWDLRRGQMLGRWRSEASEEQPVSLSNSAKYILYGSDQQTHFRKSTSNQETVFRSGDFGSHFSSVNPVQPSEVMLVKLNGVVRILNIDQLNESWKQPGRQLAEVDFHKVATKADRVVMGRWAPDGKRYYMIWESGRITELKWESGQISLLRDLIEPAEKLDLSFKSNLTKANTGASTQRGSAGIRITSRWNVDAKVRSDQEKYTLFVSVRFPGSEGLTRLAQIVFPRDAGATQMSALDNRYPSIPAVLLDSPTPSLSTLVPLQIGATQGAIGEEIIGVRSYGDAVYCATKHGEVYRATDSKLQMLGSPTVISGSGDASAQRIVTLHEGGALWRADWNEEWNWKQLPMVPADSKKIHVSPDGKQILVIRSPGNEALLLDAETGKPLVNPALRKNIIAASWNRLDSSIAMVDDSGAINLVTNDAVQLVAKIDAQDKVEEIHFFNEAWSSNKLSTRWIVARMGDNLRYFQIGGQNVATLQLPEGVTTIEPSPIEGIIAVGGQSTVAAYFSAPSLNEPGRELFSLSGHSGSKVRCLHFTQDGKTLVSTDSQNRQFSWISQPPELSPMNPPAR